MAGHSVPIPTQPHLVMPYDVAQPYEAITAIIDDEFEAKVQRIMDLGFERHLAIQALATCNNDEEAAIDHLL